MKNKLLTILPEEIENLPLDKEPEGNNFILIYFIKENNELFLNNQKPIDFSNSPEEETIIRSSDGNYQLRIYSNKNNLLEEISFEPSDNINYEILAVPNYLNIGKIEFINLFSNKKEDLNLESINICNENGICETNEENLCPLDCPSVNNPNYPFISQKPTKIKNEDLIITTITPPTIPPKNYFYQILTLSLIGFIILFLIIVIFIKKHK